MTQTSSNSTVTTYSDAALQRCLRHAWQPVVAQVMVPPNIYKQFKLLVPKTLVGQPIASYCSIKIFSQPLLPPYYMSWHDANGFVIGFLSEVRKPKQLAVGIVRRKF
jgi:hypothetical protein